MAVTFYDDSYNALGAPKTTPYAYMSGGLGDLTDGIVATQNWSDSNQSHERSISPLRRLEQRETLRFYLTLRFTSRPIQILMKSKFT